MISRFTKIQLVAFAVVTLLGAAFVGGRYANLDRLVIDRTFAITAEFSDSGGIFVGAEVTYRGIAVGRVGDLEFTDDGVKATLDIENSAPDISADLEALVANKSAIGEQYVDLRPRSNNAPYIQSGTHIGIEHTQVPIDTTTLLVDLNRLVSSVDTNDLRTVVFELGQAFEGTGVDLAAILDSAQILIGEAQDNLDVTRQLIRQSRTVLQTQIDKGSQIQSFSHDLALLTDTLVESDPQLRTLLEAGSGAVAVINAVVGENSADLSAILAGLRGPVAAIDENVAGLQAIFVLYPYLVQGSYTVATPTGDGQYNAAFGNILTLPGMLTLCSGAGYRDMRDPFDVSDVDEYGQEWFQTGLGCQDQSLTPRGSEHTGLSRTVVGTSGGSDLTWLMLGSRQ